MEQHILIIDDDARLLNGLRRTLREEPYSVELAENSAKARGILRRNPITLIVCDQQMPGCNGLELLKSIRSEYPSIKAILLTGHATSAVAQQAMTEKTVERILTKPCDPHRLIATIRSLLPKILAPTSEPMEVSKEAADPAFEKVWRRR